MTKRASARASTLFIGRLEVRALVPKDHPSPAAGRARLDEVAKNHLARTCAHRLALLCPDQDPSVWCIRRLEANITLDLGADLEHQAQGWTAELQRSLRHALNGNEDGVDLLRFPDRAAYLAQFLYDVAEGAAWTKWYYAQFEGLRALPAHAATREALCLEPALGEAALIRLADGGRHERVLHSLPEADCRAVLDSFSCLGVGTDSQGLVAEHLQTAWGAWTFVPPGEPEHRAALRLHLAIRQGEGLAVATAVQPRVIRALVALARWMFSSEAANVLDALQRDDVAGAFALVREEGVEAMTDLLRFERGAVLQIAEQLQSRAHGRQTAAATAGDGEPAVTPFGGVFYLLPRLAEFDLESCVATLPEFDDAAPVALVRFLVVLKCLGAARAPDTFFDPVLREVAGVSAQLDVDSLRAWGRRVTKAMAEKFQARWAAGCLRGGRLSFRWFIVRPARRGRLLLVSESERDTWLYAARSVDELVRFLQGVKPRNDPTAPAMLQEVEALICDPELCRTLPRTLGNVPVEGWDSPAVAARLEQHEALAARLERGHAADGDLSYLGLPLLLREARPLDLALTVVASAVMRCFAWRLPGFAESSCDYLYRNFFDATATLELESDDWHVRLSRLPLHIVLAMTGATQDRYSIPWLNNRELRLTTSN